MEGKTKGSNNSQVYLRLSFIVLAVCPVRLLLLHHHLSRHRYYDPWTPHIQSQSAFFFSDASIFYSCNILYKSMHFSKTCHLLYRASSTSTLKVSFSSLCIIASRSHLTLHISRWYVQHSKQRTMEKSNDYKLMHITNILGKLNHLFA
jgi:hypothetical protein